MKRLTTLLVAAFAFLLTLAAIAPNEASAGWRRGWGYYGPGVGVYVAPGYGYYGYGYRPYYGGGYYPYSYHGGHYRYRYHGHYYNHRGYSHHRYRYW